VLEPEGRNTAPAAALAAFLASRTDPESILLIMPADHVIQDTATFQAAIGRGATAAASGTLVTFGVTPDRPETGYGYIEATPQGDGAVAVTSFVEKPDLETARAYLSGGRHFWNSGMFLFGARKYLSELAEHAPTMLPACQAAVDAAKRDGDTLQLGDAFLKSPSDSVDYAVMEKTRDAAVVPLDAGWSDVGSWSALHEILDKDTAGNVLRGPVAAQDCRDCYVLASGRRVAVIGLENCVVVETVDAVLVMPQDRAQDLKTLIENLPRDDRRD
jgi:mannose-1-phosphate guanylyltransferase/mannose-6-phosphate isomerase